MGLTSEFARLKWSLKSEKKKQRLIDAACQFLRLWPETNGLLELARAKGIGIRFDDSLDGTDTDGVFHRNRETGECYIALKPCLEPHDIAIPLIHELRHLWQEQQLGLTPGKSGLGEKDATTALLLTRVKEADAFAFTNLMIARINHAQQDFIDSEAFGRKLLRDSGAAELSSAQQGLVDDFLAQRIANRVPAETKKMAEDFLRELGDLDSYDHSAAAEYFRRYISPTGPHLSHLTEKDGHVLGLADIRKIMQAGTFDTMPRYLADQDDAMLVQAILSGVRADLRETVSLMDAFEKAARTYAPQAELTRQQLEIGNRLLKPRP